MRPTQSSKLFQGLPTGANFQREYETQDTIPIDGSNPNGRTYSPFVIRVLPPSILGGKDANILSTGLNPQRGPGEGGTIRESNRSRIQYASTLQGVAMAPASLSSYEAMVRNGTAIPGLTSTSLAEVQSRYNSALFEQVFGPTVQRSLNGTGNTRSTTVTPAVSNDLASLSILLQVKQLLAVPPLLLLINPQSMSVQYTKVAQFQERSRYGFIYQAWGEELAKLSFTFKIGAYIAGRRSRGQEVPSGVQRASRRDSASFQQLLSLLTIFQSAGNVQDTLQNSRASLMIGNVAIEYDQKTYVGHFDTFSFSEDESQQNGGLEMELEFTAIRIFDHAQAIQTLSPLVSPSNPFNGQSRGTLSRSGREGSAQFLTSPTVGISSTRIPPQPWSGASVTTEGVQPSLVTSRRR